MKRKLFLIVALLLAMLVLFAACNLGTPGEKGEQGEQGIQGEKGEKGEPGVQGAPGKDGSMPARGLSYLLDDEENCAIIMGRGLCPDMNIVIPETIEGYPVIGIASNAFENDILKSITIPASVTSIGSSAFSGCSGLTGVTIPNSVTSIEWYAFSGCSGLTSVTIPDSVTSIGDWAFEGCPIETATIPVIACSYISNSNLKTVVITSGTSIGSYAFRDCSGLTSVTIPNSVTSIGDRAFEGCPIEIATIPAIACSYISNSNLKTVVITGGTSIDRYAFYPCISLTSVTIGNSVTSIGSEAFYYCTGLTSIEYQGTKAQWNAISKGYDWNSNTGNYTIHCTDGNIAK